MIVVIPRDAVRERTFTLVVHAAFTLFHTECAHRFIVKRQSTNGCTSIETYEADHGLESFVCARIGMSDREIEDPWFPLDSEIVRFYISCDFGIVSYRIDVDVELERYGRLTGIIFGDGKKSILAVHITIWSIRYGPG